MTFEQAIYHWVAQIPRGYVATYGQLAFLAGGPRLARKAGKAMSQAPPHIPSHRVVNSTGRTVPFWPQQRQLLQAEGVQFTQSGRVDMRRHRWQPL